MKPTPEQKKLVQDHFPEATFHRDNSITVKQSFFYTGGKTAAMFEERVKGYFPSIEVIKAFEDWRRWPTTSNWIVKFKFIK